MKPCHKQFCLLLTFIIVAISANSQTTFVLKGSIKDAQTSEALYGAQAYSYTASKGTSTNENGEYQLILPIAQSNTIIFSYIGYKKDTFEYNPQTHAALIKEGVLLKDILLEDGAHIFDQVVVTAGRSEQNLKTVTVSMELLKPYILESRNNVTLDDAIDQIPSVSFVDGQANIRGGSGWSYGAGSRVLVMLDEMPMVSGDAGQAQWGFIPVESIEQVEVIKGASSVLYGSSALNGVINIRTLRPKEKPYTNAVIYSGVYTPHDRKEGLRWQGDRILQRSGANVVHAQRWGRFDATLGINYLNDDGYRMADHEKRGRFTFNTRYTPKKIKNFYYGLNGNFQLGTVGTFLLWESFDKGYTQLDSGYSNTNGTRLNLDPYAVLYTGETRHSIRGRYFYLENRVDNGDPKNDQSNNSDYYYTEYQAQHTFKSIELSVVGGAVFNYTVTQSPVFQGFHYVTNYAPFVQVEKKWKRITANAGARYESFRLDNYTEAKPVYRTGINVEATKATFLRASYGQGYRFPSIVESYIKTSAGPLQIYPNPQLKSETGWNAEIAVKQGFKIGKFTGFVDVAGYWMEYDNMMEFTFATWGSPFTSPFFGLGFKSVNIGKTRVNGADVSFGGEGKVGNSKLTLFGGYTYVNPTNLNPAAVYATDFNGAPLKYDSTSSDVTGKTLKYRFRHLAKLDAQLEWKRFMWGASVRYNSYMENVDRIFTEPFFAIFVPGINDGRKLGEKGDYIIDVRTAYSITSALKASIIVNNLLNRVYMTRPADLRPPRLVVLQFNYKIGG